MTAPGDAGGSDGGNGSDSGDGFDDSDPELAAAVDAFLGEAETVFGEYDQGYMDADAALSRLRREVEDLESAAGE